MQVRVQDRPIGQRERPQERQCLSLATFQGDGGLLRDLPDQGRGRQLEAQGTAHADAD